MIDDIFHERNIRFHAADPKLPQRAVHALACLRQVCSPGRHFDQQRIVISSQNRARISRSAIQANTKTRRRTVGGNFSVVGRKIIRRIFGGDAALQRGTIQRNFFLRRQRQRRFMQMMPLRHQDLRAHQVDAGNHLRHGVLHLNARIHFDEIKLRGVHVIQKLHGPGVAVSGLAGQFHRGRAQFFADARRKIRRRRYFDHFLMAALHRAVAFVQMHQPAVLVAENLHLQVTSAGEIFLQENGAIAKSGTRFSLRFLQQAVQFAGIVNDAHPAPAAAHGGFHHHRVANFRRSFVRGSSGFYRLSGARQHGHARRSGQAARRRFVAQQFQELRRRADKFYPRRFAGARERRIFGQKSVAGMDGIDFPFLGQRHNAGNVEVGLDRALACSDLISLIGFEAVQGQAIFLRVDGYGAQAQLIGGAKNPDGDFAAVGRQKFADGLSGFHSVRRRSMRGILHCFMDGARLASRGFFHAANANNFCATAHEK